MNEKDVDVEERREQKRIKYISAELRKIYRRTSSGVQPLLAFEHEVRTINNKYTHRHMHTTKLWSGHRKYERCTQ